MEMTGLREEICRKHWNDLYHFYTSKHVDDYRIHIEYAVVETVREFLNRVQSLPAKYFNKFWEEREILMECVRNGTKFPIQFQTILQ